MRRAASQSRRSSSLACHAASSSRRERQEAAPALDDAIGGVEEPAVAAGHDVGRARDAKDPVGDQTVGFDEQVAEAEVIVEPGVDLARELAWADRETGASRHGAVLARDAARLETEDRPEAGRGDAGKEKQYKHQIRGASCGRRLAVYHRPRQKRK